MSTLRNLTPEQSFLFDAIDRNAHAIALLGDNIFYFGELGMQEFETAKLMTGLLEQAGFKVERGISGFPTGFCATYGSGHPVVAIHTDIGAEFASSYGLLQSALISAEFTFHGETAHAGTSPWNGRDALDGVMLMDAGMAQYREHMQPSMRAHRVVTNGGDQPNVIPRTAAIWWFFRDLSAEGATGLFEQAKRIAQGAALMSNTTYDVNVLSAVWPLRCNRTLAELVQRQIETVGMPVWTEEEETLARTLQQNAKVKVEGLRHEIKATKGEAVQRTSANDAGDISWKVPMAKFYFPSNVPNINSHHWGAGVVLAHSIAHKGAVAGAKAFAAAVMDCFAKPELVAEAKRTFKEELAGVEYKPMLPADQK